MPTPGIESRHDREGCDDCSKICMVSRFMCEAHQCGSYEEHFWTIDEWPQQLPSIFNPSLPPPFVF